MKDLKGQYVEYKDSVLKVKHTGHIVGTSEDGQWYLVQSDKPNVVKADWHFKVRVSEVDQYLRALPS